MNLVTLVDEYLYYVGSAHQPATELKYRQVLNFLLKDIGERTPIDVITESDLLKSLARWRDKKPATRRLNGGVYKWLFDYAVRKKYLKASPASDIPLPKKPKAGEVEVTILSKADVARMFSFCQNWGDEITLGVLAFTGSRRSAVSKIKWKDLDLDPDFPNAPYGWARFDEKGGKYISKPIPKLLRDIIDRCPEFPPPAPGDYLIPNERPAAVRRTERDNKMIWNRVKRIAARAGVEANVHAFRATFAVLFLETNPGHMKGLQELLGHSSIEVTQNYTRGLDKEQVMAPVVHLDYGSLNGGEDQGAPGRNGGTPLPSRSPTDVLGSPALSDSESALSEGDLESEAPKDQTRGVEAPPPPRALFRRRCDGSAS